MLKYDKDKYTKIHQNTQLTQYYMQIIKFSDNFKR